MPQFIDTRTAAPGRYFVHTQWNPKPTYDVYDEFWRNIITTDPSYNTLISLNMAAKSGIKKNGTTEAIHLPFTRVACSGDSKRDEKYMKPDTYTAFKSVFRDKWGTIFNLAYPSDSCHFLVLRRPYEMVSDSVNLTKTLLINSRMFLSVDGTLEECRKEDFALAFVKYLFSRYDSFKKEILDQIKALTFEDIEILIASCLQEEKYKWLEKDMLLRPFVWSAFFSPLGIPSEYSRDSIDFFITILKKLEQCEALGYRISPIETISRYPINLVSGNDDGYGWIFNCRGLSDVNISERVATSLRSIEGIPKGSTVTLFPTNYTAEFRADVFEKDIMSAARNISQPFDALSQNFDVRAPEARPRIRINALL